MPTLRLTQDRLIGGVPQISVTFPDGHSDNLVLNKHSDLDDHCNFIGHLENEREACVAVTGCVGQEDVELTLLSAHAAKTPMMRWAVDGTVEVINMPEVKRHTNNYQKIYSSFNNGKHAEFSLFAIPVSYYHS